MAGKISHEEAKVIVDSICENINFKLNSFEYIGSLKTILDLTCPNGHACNTTTYAKFVSRKGLKCRECLGIKKKSQEDAEMELIERCKESGYSYDNFKYIGVDKTKLNLTCNKGHQWDTTTYISFVNDKTGCPFCAGNVKHTQSYCEKVVNELCSLYGYSCEPFEYIGVDETFLSLTCNKGHTWSSTDFYHFTKKGNKCPECQSNESYKLKEIIDPMLPEFEKEKRFDDCRLVRPLPFDRYVPSLNLLIEYDGEQHFKYREYMHGDIESYNKMKERDEIKTKYAIDNGFNFIRIAYFEDCNYTLLDIIKQIIGSYNQLIKIHGVYL